MSPDKTKKPDMLLWEETLFKDRDLFELDHLPEHFAHRESQMNSLKFCVRPALQRPNLTLWTGAVAHRVPSASPAFAQLGGTRLA